MADPLKSGMKNLQYGTFKIISSSHRNCGWKTIIFFFSHWSQANVFDKSQFTTYKDDTWKIKGSVAIFFEHQSTVALAILVKHHILATVKYLSFGIYDYTFFCRSYLSLIGFKGLVKIN